MLVCLDDKVLAFHDGLISAMSMMRLSVPSMTVTTVVCCFGRKGHHEG